MGLTVSRRSLLSGAAALGTGLLDVQAARAASQPIQSASLAPLVNHFSVPFGPDGRMGGSKEGETYLEELIKAVVVPPLSDIAIYAHGWLTDASNLMVIYDTLTQGFEAELRAARRLVARAPAAAAAPSLSLPTSTLVIMTHWPSRVNEQGGPVDIADLVSFSKMEARANVIGAIGMSRLIGLVCERLLADPELAGTRVALFGHSFGGRVLAGGLHGLAARAPATFAAVEARVPMSLVMLQPAMPDDVLEPTDLAHAHPFGQLVHYRNLRILTTISQWDTPLVRYYPSQEAQQPADVQFYRSQEAHQPADTLYVPGHREARDVVPALGAVGPTDATWRAFNGTLPPFNGTLPHSSVSVGPGFQYADVLRYTGQRLVVADLTPLHAAHRAEDLARRAGEVPPMGRPDRRSMAYSGYHTDIYSREMYQLIIGFAWGRPGLSAAGEARGGSPPRF